jgi:hypothetical protein
MRKIEEENTKISGIAAIYTLSSWHCCRDAMLRVFGDKRKATNPVRHCGLDPQSPFIRFIGFARFIRREASRLYNLGDSDFRQNDGHGYGDSDLRQNDGYRYMKAMSRMGLNMYNPLQAERSWGYKMTSTLSELRSSSICYHDNHSNHINHSLDKRRRKDKGAKGRKVQATSIFSRLACLLLVACCLLPYNNVIKSNF